MRSTFNSTTRLAGTLTLRRSALAIGALMLAGGGAVSRAAVHRDYQFVGLTYGTHDLIYFDSDNPGTITNRVHMSGASNVNALAVRPSTRELYGLSWGSTLVKIDPKTGAATALWTGSVQQIDTSSMTSYGGIVGIDFEPGTEYVRALWASGLTYRIHPDTGALIDADPVKPGIQPDRDRLWFVAGDARAVDEIPLPLGFAYDRSDPATPAYTVHGRNGTALGKIASFGAPRGTDAIFTTVGEMGIGGGTGDCSDLLEIASDGAAFLITQRINRLGAYLASVDLTTGSFSPSEQWPSHPLTGTDIITDENLRAFCISPLAEPWEPLPQEPPPPPILPPPPPADTFPMGEPPVLDDVVIRVDLTRPQSDTVTIGGSLAFTTPDPLAGQHVDIVAGAAHQDFDVGAHRTARDGGSVLRFARPHHGRVRFRVKLSSTDMAGDVESAAADGTRTLPVVITMAGEHHASEIRLRVATHGRRRIARGRQD